MTIFTNVIIFNIGLIENKNKTEIINIVRSHNTAPEKFVQWDSISEELDSSQYFNMTDNKLFTFTFQYCDITGTL